MFIFGECSKRLSACDIRNRRMAHASGHPAKIEKEREHRHFDACPRQLHHRRILAFVPINLSRPTATSKQGENATLSFGGSEEGCNTEKTAHL